MTHAQPQPVLPQAPTPESSTTNGSCAVRRYREKRRRIDYYPSADVLAAIEAATAAGLSNCLAGVIDALIHEGRLAISGKVPGQR